MWRPSAEVLDEDGRELVECAVDGVGRTSELIDGNLAYPRIETGGARFDPADLDDGLEVARAIAPRRAAI